MKANILVVDDESGVRDALKMVLGYAGYQVSEAESAAALQRCFPEKAPDVVLLDVRLPDADGLDLLPQIKKRWPETEVIVLTGHGTMDMAVEATKRGAYNFLSKPFENEKLLADVKCAVERSYLDWAFEEMGGPVFRSSSMNDVVTTVKRVANSDVAILITGESGTGK